MTTKHASCTHPSTSAARAACRKAQGSLSASATPQASRGRTDVHRPAEMRPEDYTFSHCGSRAEDTDPYTRRAAAEMLRRLIDQGHRWAAHHGAGKCDHCGTGILHYAVMIHRPTGELIEIGETCLDGRFEMANSEFREMQKRLKAARVGRAKKARIAALIEEHPLLAELQRIHNESMDDSFLGSLASQFIAKGELSEKQIAAAERAILRDAHTEALRENAARDRADRDLAPLTAGKRTITGTVKKTKWIDSQYGGSLKCLIEDDEGYRFWGTVPRAYDGQEGDAISITASVEVSDDDPTFAFFKRPRLV
jgi:hypothetical protein